MTGLYQSYFENITAALQLVKPQITPDMSEEQIISTIRHCAERLFQIHRENDGILNEILFSKTAQTLTEEEAGQLLELADALFNYNRSPDVGIAYYIHKLLYSYAQLKGDVDLIVQELYYQGITLMYLNVHTPDRGTNLFVEQIGAFFRGGASYLDRYEELKNSKTRSCVVRCLGNVKYGLKSFQGDNSGKTHQIRSGWEDYQRCFEQAMEVINAPYYRQMNPEIPWDVFAYSMHYDRTQFLSSLRSKEEPEIVKAVLESAEYVYHHREQSVREKEKAVGARTRYVYTAARYHARLIPIQELVRELLDMCESADLHDFSGDNIWVLLSTPEYLIHYAQDLPREELEKIQPRLGRALDKQKEYLFLLPRNEYAVQVSRSLQIVANYISSRDPQFNHRALDYILACHAPTFVHSKIIALLARRFCARMAETAPELLAGTFGIETVDNSPENLEKLLDMTYHTGLYHDLGKCMLLTYVGQYTRRLLDEEFSCIKLHTIFGCDLLVTMGMEQMSNAAYYHHCAYDGSGGYPEVSRMCPASVRRVVDIITVVDCLDAGTDNIGRSYAASKTYEQLVEELRRGKGHRYAPEVVELLDDPDFYRETEKFLTDSRIQVYLDAYRSKQ